MNRLKSLLYLLGIVAFLSIRTAYSATTIILNEENDNIEATSTAKPSPAAAAAATETAKASRKPSANDNGAGGKCEQIQLPMCLNMPYNQTSMPNQFNHQSQQEAAMEAHQFWALVEINCAKELRFFLCSMYTPICLSDYTRPIRACRSVCKSNLSSYFMSARKQVIEY